MDLGGVARALFKFFFILIFIIGCISFYIFFF